MKNKIYLLGGNGSSSEWWEKCLPHFNKYEPVPVELPGFGKNSSQKIINVQSQSGCLTNTTDKGSIILAQGISSIIALKAEAFNPGHFKKIILINPVGVFLWKRALPFFMKFNIIGRAAKFLITGTSFLDKKLGLDKMNKEDKETIKRGYKSCTAFEQYFKMIKAYDAFDLTEWITAPVEIFWGANDKVADVKHLAAWQAVLPRADVKYKIISHWEHYPFLTHSQEFVSEIESGCSISAHTKHSRLELAASWGINVPKFNVYSAKERIPEDFDPKKLYAVRSSSAFEDKAEESKAGMYESFIRVKSMDIQEKVKYLLEKNVDTVIVQEFIEPEVSGVAFVRNLSSEIEWVHGHLESLTSGKVTPFKTTLSKMGGQWQKNWNIYVEDSPFTLLLNELNEFLRNVLECFHYTYCDIEWAWDKNKFYLLQCRPVTSYNWHRLITGANIDEILPKKVSKIMEFAQRRASTSIGKIYGSFDKGCIEDNEPFSAVYDDASYINSDLFLSRFKSWGLPGKLYFKEIGGHSEGINFNLFKFISSIPVLLRMHFTFRRIIIKNADNLKKFEEEIIQISGIQNHIEKQDKAVWWFVKFYLFIVQTNIVIKGLIAASMGSFLGEPETIYKEVNKEDFPHRVKYESDPASIRNNENYQQLRDFPRWNAIERIAHKTGLPGMEGKYIELREWFRDNNMRLFHRLHFILKGSEWLNEYGSTREMSGTFWQDEGKEMLQGFDLVIYPGKAEGIEGKDILIVNNLEPGHIFHYKNFKAVISANGGRMSHGSILLRELKIPSAIISSIKIDELKGKRLVYDNGKINAGA